MNLFRAARKIKRWMLAGILFCFASIALAAPATVITPFDHARTGFILRDVHVTLKCEQCHVDAIFKNTPRNCAGCHTAGSRVGAKPKPINHVQTTQACDTCHTSPTSFLVKNFNHPGIISGCASCHNGQSSGVAGKPANHFPTGLPCESCHTNTSTFMSWRMDHTGVTGNCTACHGGQFPGIVRKPDAHIVTTADCGTCHGTTTFSGVAFDHTAVTPGACGTCHGGTGSQSGAVTRPATHIPTTIAGNPINACDACHTQSNTGNYSSFLGVAYHKTPGAPSATGNCLTCHTGAYPAAKGKSFLPTHLPTTAQCSECHNTTTFVGASTLHTAAFLGAAPTCATCHNGSTAKGKPAFHIQTALDCGNSSCHTASNTNSYTTFFGAAFSHVAISGARCDSCHNGTTAKGKSITHVPTTAGQDCVVCHTQANTGNYTSFFGAVFSHVNVTQPCANCHNGTIALGKSASHLPTTAACDTCHTNTANFTTWLGATFSHSGITQPCATCHNGSIATGKSPTHVATPAACDTCHTNTANFTSWLGATFSHSGITQPCSSCHNGTIATGKSLSHIATAGECNTCHINTANFTTWIGAIFTHNPNPPTPGSCIACHNGSTATGKPSWHIVTTASCEQCHTTANTQNYTTFQGASGANHDSTTANNCQTCHNGATAKGQSTGHIPTGALSCDSGDCHAVYNGTTVTTFSSGIMDHSVVTATRCYACHNGSYVAQGNQHGGAVAMPGNHIPLTITGGVGGLECTTCHRNFNVSGASAWLPATMDHNNAAGMGSPIYCVTCHLSGTNYLGVKDKKSHKGASTAKDCSSSSCHAPLGKEGIKYSDWK